MQFNSKVYLKRQEESLVLSEAGAKKIQDVFLDSSIPFDQPLNIGRVSFFKSEIRKIEVLPDTKNNDEYIKKKCWIIYSPSRNSILSKSFNTKQEAEKELEIQSIENKNHDYVVIEN